MRGMVLAALALAAAGCAAWPRPGGPLARADRLVEQGEYVAAVQAYDEALARHPADPEAPRARASRDMLNSLIAARADVARLRESLAARDAELTRLRQEVQRLTQEADRLRADLETLKEIDLRQERKRR